jgi:methionyl-tRNA synthetase
MFLLRSRRKKLYVWFDAPIGYISATKNGQREGKEWEPLEDQDKLVHFIGKDNIVFHCVFSGDVKSRKLYFTRQRTCK